MAFHWAMGHQLETTGLHRTGKCYFSSIIAKTFTVDYWVLASPQAGPTRGGYKTHIGPGMVIVRMLRFSVIKPKITIARQLPV